MRFATPEVLKKMNKKRLVSYLDRVRAERSRIFHYYGPRCCEICNEYIGSDWENDVGKHLIPYDCEILDIKNRLKQIQ